MLDVICLIIDDLTRAKTAHYCPARDVMYTKFYIYIYTPFHHYDEVNLFNCHQFAVTSVQL